MMYASMVAKENDQLTGEIGWEAISPLAALYYSYLFNNALLASTFLVCCAWLSFREFSR